MNSVLPDFPFLHAARQAGATDLTVTCGRPVRARLPAGLAALPEIPEPEFLHFASALGDRHPPLSVGSFSHGGERLRFVYYHSESGPTFELRFLPASLPTWDSLHLPPAFPPLLQRSRGLILVSGPTGSGKSTTLAAVIDRLNASGSDLKIITLEDPIEYLHAEKRAVVRQCEYHRDFASYPAAIRALLRQDPDVALIGELRDPACMRAALTAAETGHLVFSTLHARDAVGAAARILDAAPHDEIPSLLAGSLAGILAQQLVPALAGGCVAAFELLLSTPAVRTCLREKRLDHLRDEIRRGQSHGMVTMDDSLLSLHRRRIVSTDAALGAAHDPDALRSKLAPLQP